MRRWRHERSHRGGVHSNTSDAEAQTNRAPLLLLQCLHNLRVVCRDGFTYMMHNVLQRLVDDKYPRLTDSSRQQVWPCSSSTPSPESAINPLLLSLSLCLSVCVCLDKRRGALRSNIYTSTGGMCGAWEGCGEGTGRGEEGQPLNDTYLLMYHSILEEVRRCIYCSR